MTAASERSAQPPWDPDLHPDDSYKWKAFWAVGLSLVAMVMSTSMVFLALPSIADDFGVTLKTVSWVVIAQSLTISSVMLPLGRVADLTGRKRFHLTGLVLFGGGAVFAAFSPDLPTLVAARVVMAVGSSMGQAVSTAIVASVFPQRERGKGLGSQTTAVAIGGASGPILAGLLLTVWSWQALFIFIAIPTVIAFAWGFYILDDERIGSFRGERRERYDWAGALTSATAVVVIVITISNPFSAPWSSPLILGGVLGAIALFGVFVWWELRVAAPMLDLRLFKNKIYRYAIATRYLGFMGRSATFFLLPIFLLSLRGISEAATGGIMFVGALGMGIAAQTSGRLSDRFGYRRFTFMGFAVLISSAIAFAFFDRATPVWVMLPVLFFNGIGMGLWAAPNMSATIGAVPRSSYGVVSAFVNLTRNVGNVTGQTIVATMIAGFMVARGFDIQLSAISTTPGAGDAFLSGWRAAYLVVVGFSVAALIAAFMTREGKRP